MSEEPIPPDFERYGLPDAALVCFLAAVVTWIAASITLLISSGGK